MLVHDIISIIVQFVDGHERLHLRANSACPSLSIMRTDDELIIGQGNKMHHINHTAILSYHYVGKAKEEN